jgi:hypothetical protein
VLWTGGLENAASGAAHHDIHASVNSTNQVSTPVWVHYELRFIRFIAVVYIQDSIRSVDAEPVDGGCGNHVCDTKYGFYRYGPILSQRIHV